VATINLPLAYQQGRIFHELVESFAGRGELLFRSSGLDPTRPVPLPVIEQRFAIGAPDRMEPGRNLDLPLAIFGSDGEDVLSLFGFAIEFVREPSWLTKVPFAPSGAVAAGDTVWTVYLLDRPEPVSEVTRVARRVHAFASPNGPGDIGPLRGIPLAGSIYTSPIGRSDPVELKLAWLTRPRPCTIDR